MAKTAPSKIRIEGKFAFVELTRGFEARIDLADVPIVEGFRWTALVTRTGHTYANRSKTVGVPYVLMHRLLLCPASYQQIDHEDGDGLNNARYNIRIATRTENMANRGHDRRNLLGIKGVSRNNRGGRFKAHITINVNKITLGSFDTTAEASAAYIGAAKIAWGDFARR